MTSLGAPLPAEASGPSFVSSSPSSLTSPSASTRPPPPHSSPAGDGQPSESLAAPAPGMPSALRQQLPAGPAYLTQATPARQMPARGQPVFVRDSIARRTGPGHQGSRRHRRWERNNFVGNPHVVFPASFDPSSFPGIPYEVPRFHFSYEYIRKLATQLGPPSTPLSLRKKQLRKNKNVGRTCGAPGSGSDGDGTDNAEEDRRPLGGENLGRQMRKALKQNVPRGLVVAYEVPLRKYLEELKNMEAAVDEPSQQQPQQQSAVSDDGPGGADARETSSSSDHGSDSSQDGASYELCDVESEDPVLVDQQDWDSEDASGMVRSVLSDGNDAGDEDFVHATTDCSLQKENAAPVPSDPVEGSLTVADNVYENGPTRTLVLEIDNAFSRYVFHTMCTYYSLHSYSEDGEDGKRRTHVCWTGLGTKQLVIPKRSYHEWLFAEEASS